MPINSTRTGNKPFREALAYYPDPVWLYVFASQWSRIAEEAFVGRCAHVGDDLGSTVVPDGWCATSCGSV